ASGGGRRSQTSGSADRGADGVAHLGSAAGTSSPRSLCGPWGRVGGGHPSHGDDGNRVSRRGATLGVLPARLVLARAGAEPGLPRQVPGGLAAGLPGRWAAVRCEHPALGEPAGMAEIGTRVVAEAVGGVGGEAIWRSRAGAQVLNWVRAPSRLAQSP